MDLEKEMAQQFVTEIECRTPLGRMGDVKDLKGIAVFLARLGLPHRLHRRCGRRLAGLVAGAKEGALAFGRRTVGGADGRRGVIRAVVSSPRGG